MIERKKVLMFLFVAVFIVALTFELHKPINLSFCSEVLVVPDMFERISWAIGNASNGDIVLVKSNVTAYHETKIHVNKSLTIVGERKETTVIDGSNGSEVIVLIAADNVVIENFTLRNMNLQSLDPAIRLYKTQNVTVKNLIVKNVPIGIEIFSSNRSDIIYNEIKGTRGVYIRDHSSNNTLLGNTFENNNIAVHIADRTCKFNEIHHNNFINNTNNIINYGSIIADAGYPSGGNYWSDHVSEDLYNGPYQNESGSDGILDEPYDSLDNYPFANPIINIQITIDGKQCVIVQVSTSSNLTYYQFDQADNTLTFFVKGLEEINGSIRLAVPKELTTLSPYNWTILIFNSDIKKVNPDWSSEDAQNFYIYFTYHHVSTQKIEVVLPENISMLMLTLLVSTLTILIATKHRKKIKRGG